MRILSLDISKRYIGHIYRCSIWRGTDVLELAMDRAVRGHLAGKAPIDAAMWDLRGKILGQPVSALLGGTHRRTYPVFYPISFAEPAQMAREAGERHREGYRHWQLKVGGDPDVDGERVRASSSRPLIEL